MPRLPVSRGPFSRALLPLAACAPVLFAQGGQELSRATHEGRLRAPEGFWAVQATRSQAG